MSGKIYKITGYGLVYYGSTTKTLNRRKNGHKADYERYKSGNHRYTSSYDILEQGDDWCIELVEIVEDKDQLLIREKYYIKNYECVNKYSPFRTEEEKKEYKKEQMAQYRAENRENREKSKAKKRERVQCPRCNKDLSRDSLRRHIKRKHKE